MINTMSVYATALNGLQTQSRAVQQYAQNLATGTGYRASTDASGTPIPEDIVSFSDTATEALIGLDVAKNLFAANTKVIATQSKMDEALLDILS